MSSKQPAEPSLTVTAEKVGAEVHRRVLARRGGGRGGSRGLGVADLHNELTSEGLDLAKDVAGVMLRTAMTVGQDVLEAVEELESLVTDRRPGSAPAPSGGAVTSGAVPLALPDTSPDRSGSSVLVVRNDSENTIDAMRLRCSGLYATGSLHISGSNVKFAPVTVDVLPRRTANVTCEVRVPRAAKRGHYVGLIEAIDLEGVQLQVTLNVI